MDIGEVNARLRELINEGSTDIFGTLRTELMDYFSTPEGRAEIDHSPNKHMKTEEAVAVLMQGVPARVERLRKEKRGC